MTPQTQHQSILSSSVRSQKTNIIDVEVFLHSRTRRRERCADREELVTEYLILILDGKSRVHQIVRRQAVDRIGSARTSCVRAVVAHSAGGNFHVPGEEDVVRHGGSLGRAIGVFASNVSGELVGSGFLDVDESAHASGMWHLVVVDLWVDRPRVFPSVGGFRPPELRLEIFPPVPLIGAVVVGRHPGP